jgi:predicted nucleic acid-binding protein
VTAVVIDASAGVEMVAGTRRGAAPAKLLSAEAEGWVPEHFYAEVLAVLWTARYRFAPQRSAQLARAGSAASAFRLDVSA